MRGGMRGLDSLQHLFGPNAQASGNKKGAAAEAGRPEEKKMLDTVTLNNYEGNASGGGAAGAASPLSLIRNGAVRLTAEQAGAILRLTRYEGQKRDLRPAGRDHIAVLKDIMARGQWRHFDKLDFASLEGRLILINGHHRLAAQSLSGQVIPWVVVVHACNSEQEVAKLYYSFDTNQRGRSNETILSAAGAAELLGVTKTSCEALYRATPLLVSNFDFSRVAQDPVMNRVIDRRFEVMKSYQNEVMSWQRAIKSAPPNIKKLLQNQGPVAVAMATFRHQSDAANAFWTGLADDDGLVKGDPRKTYLTALLNTTSYGNSNIFTARQAAIAWNAFFDGRKLAILKIVEAHPFRIAGTPIGR